MSLEMNEILLLMEIDKRLSWEGSCIKESAEEFFCNCIYLSNNFSEVLGPSRGVPWQNFDGTIWQK